MHVKRNLADWKLEELEWIVELWSGAHVLLIEYHQTLFHITHFPTLTESKVKSK